jgi:hypothetical protein
MFGLVVAVPQRTGRGGRPKNARAISLRLTTGLGVSRYSLTPQLAVAIGQELVAAGGVGT